MPNYRTLFPTIYLVKVSSNLEQLDVSREYTWDKTRIDYFMSDEVYGGEANQAETSALAYGGPADVAKSFHDPRLPIRRKLEIRIKQKEEELAELKGALEALDRNPEYEKLHDTLARVSRFL